MAGTPESQQVRKRWALLGNAQHTCGEAWEAGMMVTWMLTTSFPGLSGKGQSLEGT
jgi:hypothetical protein